MSFLDNMLHALNRIPREVVVVRIEHASPDFMDGMQKKCIVHDSKLDGGSYLDGIPIVLNPKLPLGLVRTVMSDGAVMDQRVPLFTDPFDTKDNA